MVKIAERFLPFCAICAALRAEQMAISNSHLIKIQLGSGGIGFESNLHKKDGLTL